MAIQTKAVYRYSKPGDTDSPKLLYRTQVAMGYADIDELAANISRGSSLSEGDVLSVCRQLTFEIASILKSGRSVRLGKLGSFSNRVRSMGVDGVTTRSEASDVKGLKIAFYAGTLLRKEMGDVKFAAIEDLITDGTVIPEPDDNEDTGGTGGNQGGATDGEDDTTEDPLA